MPRAILLSDTHGRHDDVAVPDDGDLLIHAGDVTNRGSRDEVEDFADWLSPRPHPHKIVVAGNHDRWIEKHPQRMPEILSDASYLQDGSTDAGPLTVWGSPWTPQFFDWSFMLPRGDELAAKWAQIPDDIDILVTHGPPRGILDRTRAGIDAGCDALRDRVFEIQPRLHVFGHIHEARGRVEHDGITFVNASCFESDSPFVVDL